MNKNYNSIFVILNNTGWEILINLIADLGAIVEK